MVRARGPARQRPAGKTVPAPRTGGPGRYHGGVERRRALETRPFRVKAPLVRFFCPLCGSERALARSHRLAPRHKAQVLFLTLLTTALLHPVAGWRGVLSVLVWWPAFELAVRALYRKDVPCPYCGFDAVWYRRDAGKARELVRRFWEGRPAPAPGGARSPAASPGPGA